MTELSRSLYSEDKKSKLNILLNVLIILIAVLLVFELLFSANYSGIYVVGPSMNNTLTGADAENEAGGDYVYVNRRVKPDYGDIVVVAKDEETTIIKRVIALGGDRIKLVNGKLYIMYKGDDEFTEIEEEYVSTENNTGEGNQPLDFPTRHGAIVSSGFLVRENHMFLMGDNRDWSLDSREGGGRDFPVSSLYGVVTSWSLNGKKFFTAIHTYFHFDLPRYFGIKK